MQPEADVLRLRGPLELPSFAEEHTHRNRVDRKGVVTLCCEDLDAGSRVHLKTDGFVAVCEFAWRTAGAMPADRGRGMQQFLNAFIEKHHGRESPELVLMDQQYVMQCAVRAGKNCAVASCKVRRVCDVPVIKSALYKYLKDSGAKRFGRILLRYDRNVVPGWMRMEIQDRKRAQEILVYGTSRVLGAAACTQKSDATVGRRAEPGGHARGRPGGQAADVAPGRLLPRAGGVLRELDRTDAH